MSAECISKGGRVFSPKDIAVAVMDTLREQGGDNLLAEQILGGRVHRDDLFSDGPEGIISRTPLESEPDETSPDQPTGNQP